MTNIRALTPVHTGKPDILEGNDVTLIHTVFDNAGRTDLHAGFAGRAMSAPKFKRDKGWFVDVQFFGRDTIRLIACSYLTNKKLSEI